MNNVPNNFLFTQNSNQLTEIKNAMAAAIFAFIENDCCSKDYPGFTVCHTIYLEADFLLQLQQKK
jgi:hypothetical protein